MSNIKKFLILGHPRSGTLYSAIAFEGIGLHVSHEIDEEHVYSKYGIKTYYNGVVTGMFKNAKYDLSKYDVILHQVRNPLATISSSFHCKGRIAVETIHRFGDKIIPDNELERHMKSWLVFTDAADKVAQYTYRLESIQSEFAYICKNLLGIEKPVRFRRMMQRYNHRRHYQHKWYEFEKINADLTKKIKQKAIKYGYRIGR